MAWSPPRQIKGSPDSIARPTSRSMRSHGSEAPLNWMRSEEHTSELQSQPNLVCRLLLEKKKNGPAIHHDPSFRTTPRHMSLAVRDGILNHVSRSMTPAPRSWHEARGAVIASRLTHHAH